MPLLEVRALRKSFGDHEVIRGVDFTMQPGDVDFIVGPSGSGKSTFLRCLNFLEPPDQGTIVFDGHSLLGASGAARRTDLQKARAEMPMVFQHFNLFRHRTVLGNVCEGPVVVQKRARGEIEAEAREILGSLGLADKADAYPAQLSGGQQQRVGIARALAMRPKLILFDEPTSSLDPELVSGVLDAIRQLADEGMTMIVVTHEMAFARKLADRVHFMDNGVFLEEGPPADVFGAPKHARVKAFISSMLR